MSTRGKNKKKDANWHTVPNKKSQKRSPKGQTQSNEELPLRTDFLQRIAENIPAKKWKPVFRDLMSTYKSQSPDVLIGDIEKDNMGDVVEQKYKALRKWQSIMGRQATWATLEGTLIKHHSRIDLEELHDLHLSSPPGPMVESEVTETASIPKERQPIHIVWKGGNLIIQKGSTQLSIPLQHRVDDPEETSHRVTISDAMLVSIINPNRSDYLYKMALSEVKERFSQKFGKTLAFNDLGVGGIKSFVMDRSTRLKLTEENQQFIVEERIEQGSDSVDYDSEVDKVSIDCESEQGYLYETASEMSSACPSPASAMFRRGKPPGESMTQNTSRKPRRRLFAESPEVKSGRKIGEEELSQLTGKCEGNRLVFRTEDDYTGEKGSKVFTKDVVALWNTPRKGNADAHIVVGIKPNTTPPYDFQGLKEINKLDEDYQNKFRVESFTYKPRFVYYEVPYLGKVFGVVGIASGENYGDICYAKDTCEEWCQNDILLRDSNKCTCATRNDLLRLCAWFLKTPSFDPSSPQKDREDEAWGEFVQQLDVENYQRRNYCLLVSRCSPETPNVKNVGRFPWLKVWDFDPDSRESGLLSKCEEEMQNLFSVRTWNDPPQTSSPEWLFVRGLRKREDSLALGKVKEWGKLVGLALNAQCDQIRKLSEKKPLTVIVLWYGSSDCIRHLHKALGKIDESLNIITYIICMQQIPNDEDGRYAIKELCEQMEISKIIEIPLERLCSGLRDLPCCKKLSMKSHELPGKCGDTISSRDSQWLQQELDVLYCGEYSTENGSSNGEAFLKGGNLTWQEMELNIYDAQRTILQDLTSHLQHRLFKELSGNVTLFHEPGAGGTALCRRILWNLHRDFPCVCATSDVIDPSKILQRLDFLYQRTCLPILLLVDGQESRLVKELLEMREEIQIVVLSVQRYTIEIGHKVSQGDKFWLKGEVDHKEAVRFSQKFSPKCIPGKMKKLQEMVQDVEENTSSHYVYEFGLAVYDTDYIGLRSYVAGYLGLKRNADLTSWQKAVTYLALAFYYGHKSIPCQFFSTLFGKKESEVVTADDVLTHSGKQFVLEDAKNCTWRITHHAVAKEILEQILYGRQTDTKGTQLSIKARRNLKELAKEFLTYASKKQECSKLDHSSSVMDMLRAMFIHRDYIDIVQDEPNRRERLSRLISDIPSTNSSKDQLELMKHLVDCFPDDPTFVSHLGRAHAFITKDYDLAQKHLSRAKELRLTEIRENKDKHSRVRRVPGDQASEDNIEPDSLLCTIEHCLGILSHERIKEHIGGGKHGDDKYKCALDEANGILTDIQKNARTAIFHFSNCRQNLTNGMNMSYGYIGEIKVRLHVADFVEKSYKPGGYYGFLKSEHSFELKRFVESCFCRIDTLIREYQDLMKPSCTSKAVTKELDTCQNWFNAIFHDPETALKFWQGKDDVDNIRNKIAVYKLKHQRQHKAPTCRSAAQVLKTITGDDLKHVTQLYEELFQQAYRRSWQTDISTELRDWLTVIRTFQQPATYSMAKAVLPQVEKCHGVSPYSATVLYYLYVLNTTLGILNQKMYMYLAESNKLLEKLKSVHSKISYHRRVHSWEWLGSDRSDSSIRRLVHSSSLGVWNSEKRFWRDERAHGQLQVCTGVIKNCTSPKLGHIGVIIGGVTGGHDSSSLQAVYAPKLSELFGDNYLNTEVEFYIGFNIQNGIEAYNVLELKKYPCSHCDETVPVSRLVKPARKVCEKCGHAVHISADSES